MTERVRRRVSLWVRYAYGQITWAQFMEAASRGDNNFDNAERGAYRDCVAALRTKYMRAKCGRGSPDVPPTLTR